MAYNPNVPAPTNRVQDDIAAMRGNFQHLAPLAQLAPVASGLQTVSELAPYVQALLDSRIVEMGTNSNGTYVRFENGWQVCWHILASVRSTTTVTGPLYRDDDATTWTFPAAFITSPAVYGTVLRVSDDNGRLFSAPNSVTTTSVTYRDVATVSGGTLARQDQLLALGRWK